MPANPIFVTAVPYSYQFAEPIILLLSIKRICIRVLIVSIARFWALPPPRPIQTSAYNDDVQWSQLTGIRPPVGTKL